MTPERLDEIAAAVKESNFETWGQELPPATYRVLMDGVHELLAEAIRLRAHLSAANRAIAAQPNAEAIRDRMALELLTEQAENRDPR